MMLDGFGRQVNYLRLSVTDRCDFRCTYCMAEEMHFVSREEILTLEECLFIARAFVGMGVEKIRLTGGEPLVRKDFPWLAARIRELPGLRELAVTSNASQLSQFAGPLKQAGVDRINISLDTLDAAAFTRLTRGADLAQVLAGLDAAIAAFGKRNVKLNTVMLKGINDHELNAMLEFALAKGVDISFIERMPMGKTGDECDGSFYSSTDALEQLGQRHELISSAESSGGPARYWHIPGHESRAGFISPHSQNFCDDCNRVRVTARGELYPCLGNEGRVDLLPAVRSGDEAALRELIRQAVAAKPEAHAFDTQQPEPRILRFMSHTGG